MKRQANYNTKQREAILDYLVSQGGEYATIAQMYEHFRSNNIPIGRTTIYRTLEKLTELGKVHKLVSDRISGACYRYADDDASGSLHLICDSCGELQHLTCDKIHEIQQHIFNDHLFEIDASKSVLHGKCSGCQQKD